MDSITPTDQLTLTVDSLNDRCYLLFAILAFVYSPNITTLSQVVNGQCEKFFTTIKYYQFQIIVSFSVFYTVFTSVSGGGAIFATNH